MAVRLYESILRTRFFCRPSSHAVKFVHSKAKPLGDTEKTVISSSTRPQTFQLDGVEVVPSEKWNLSSAVLRMLDRRLLFEEGNPLNLLKRRILDHMQKEYRKAGNRSPLFTVCDQEPRLVSVWDNFDSLLTPEDHVSRRPSDTYYVNDSHCLRAHTSAHQHKLIRQGFDNFLVVGDVYRRDAIDRTHFPCFHQIEGVQLYTPNQLFNSPLGKEVTMFEKGERLPEKQESHTVDAANVTTFKLKEVLEKLCRHVFGNDIETRWVDAYFPFTHPSFELEIFYEGKWLEVLGCGVIEQNLLRSAGVADKVGWAFGLGLERLAMVLYGIPDIRLFWSRDSGFTSQFLGKSPSENYKYRAVSAHPQVIFDISFWMPKGTNGEEMTANAYDLMRSVGGDLIEQVSLTDSFTNKKTGLSSQTYRLVYRSMERALTKNEVNVIHRHIEKELSNQYGVQLR